MNVEWEILGATQGIKAYCENCRTSFHIEIPSLTTHIKHCGVRTRLPEKIYERWCEVKEMKLTGRLMNPIAGQQPPSLDDVFNKNMANAKMRHI